MLHHWQMLGIPLVTPNSDAVDGVSGCAWSIGASPPWWQGPLLHLQFAPKKLCTQLYHSNGGNYNVILNNLHLFVVSHCQIQAALVQFFLSGISLLVMLKLILQIGWRHPQSTCLVYGFKTFVNIFWAYHVRLLKNLVLVLVELIKFLVNQFQ